MARKTESCVESEDREIEQKLAELKRKLAKMPEPKINQVGHLRRNVMWRGLLFQLYQRNGEFKPGECFTFLNMATLDAKEKLLAATVEKFIKETRWESFRSLKLPGVHYTDTTLVLMCDAVLLFCCPNAYSHLLRDALTLRLKDYRIAWERLLHFKDCIKWAEITSQRAWLRIYDKQPPKPASNWWGKAELWR